MISRLLLLASVVLLASCDGGEPDAGSVDAVDQGTAAVPASKPASGSAKVDIPVRPSKSARAHAESPIDERGGFGLVGPVRRMERHEAGFTMTKEGYDQNPLVLRQVLVFDEHGQLLSCRTDRGPATIERDKQGRLVRVFMDTGSSTMKVTEVTMFTGQALEQELLVHDVSGVPISRTLFMRDRQGRIEEERSSHWGLMDTSHTLKWEYDDRGRPTKKQKMSRGKLDGSTFINYGFESGAVEKEQFRDPAGTLQSTVRVTRDDARNWTRRHETQHIYDGRGLITDRPRILVVQEIDYHEHLDKTGSAGPEDQEAE
ncbi:MAG: hypothetical protein P8K80_07230 [Phycisphaerales bacterium]|nr:hypothetical protein [Phycisphaerales bacterium]